MGYNEEALEAYNNYLSLKSQSSQLDFVRHQVMKLSSEDKRPEEDFTLEKKQLEQNP
ncbi:MAG: hypothetical protein JRI56_10120 [Deltaproteobacteria bacterium]|nr:hypothetical protein [Deltaproteobacteria bacterium]